MNSIESILNLGVIKIYFDLELERTKFEIEYLMNQNKVIYSFINFEEWDKKNQKKITVYGIDFFL